MTSRPALYGGRGYTTSVHTTWDCHLLKLKLVNVVLLGPDEVHTSDYHLIAGDIRNVCELEQKLTTNGMDKR